MEYIPQTQKSLLKGVSLPISKPAVAPKNELLQLLERIEALATRITQLEENFCNLKAEMMAQEPKDVIEPQPEVPQEQEVEPVQPDAISSMDRSDLLFLAASLGVKPVNNTAKLIKAIRKAQQSS